MTTKTNANSAKLRARLADRLADSDISLVKMVRMLRATTVDSNGFKGLISHQSSPEFMFALANNFIDVKFGKYYRTNIGSIAAGLR